MKVTLTRCGLTVYAGYYFLKMNRRGAVTRDTRHTLYTRVEEDDEIALCPRPTALLYLRYTGPHISHTLCRATRHRAPLPLARFRHARAPARAEHTQSSCVRSPDRAEQCALGAQDSRGTGDGHAFDSLSRETRAAVVSHILCQEVGKAHRLLENKFISKSKYELDTRCLSQD